MYTIQTLYNFSFAWIFWQFSAWAPNSQDWDLKPQPGRLKIPGRAHESDSLECRGQEVYLDRSTVKNGFLESGIACIIMVYQLLFEPGHFFLTKKGRKKPTILSEKQKFSDFVTFIVKTKAPFVKPTDPCRNWVPLGVWRDASFFSSLGTLWRTHQGLTRGRWGLRMGGW